MNDTSPNTSGTSVIGARDLAGKPMGFAFNSEGILTHRYPSPSTWPQKPEGRGVRLEFKGDQALIKKLLSNSELWKLPPGSVIDVAGLTVVPAAIDAHIHSRDPGLTHKEDWHTVALGAAKGGVSAVCDMPNTIPPTLFREDVLFKAQKAASSGVGFKIILGVSAKNIDQVGRILSDPDLPVCALKVFYGKTTGELLYDDLETLARVLPEDGSKTVVFHSEDQCQVDCNEKKFGHLLSRNAPEDFAVHSQIRSSEAAHESTRTILDWALNSYKRPVHIAHVSTPLEIELIGHYKAKGLHCTSEIAPHHLLFSTEDYPLLGPFGKMNPPLRSLDEVKALRQLVAMGAVDMFATDHAPHSLAEKKTSVGKAPSGVPALEYFWPLVLRCAEVCGIPLDFEYNGRNLLLTMASETPASLFGFPKQGKIEPGYFADFAVLSSATYRVSDEPVVSKCGWTPYSDMTLPKGVLATFWKGQKVYPRSL